MSKTLRYGISRGGNIGETTAALALVLLMVLGTLPLSFFTHDAQSLQSTTPPVDTLDDEQAFNTTSCHSSSFTGNPPHTLGAPLSINTTSFAWWDSNWHYRIPFNVTGTGNVSATVDFTKNLTTLKISDKALENSTITIVRYYDNGSIAGTVTPYNVTLNAFVQNDTNVYSGTLTWPILTPAVYYVYFDVVTNKGTRSHLPSSNLSASGDAHVSSFGPPEGWWSELATPFASYYQPNLNVTISVNTTAKAERVTARFFRNGTFSFSRTFSTMNHLRWINQTMFQKRGNWTVKIDASDDAGYHATILTAEFWVGYPDLALSKLNVISTPYYKGKTLTIQAFVTCANATLQQVNVSVKIGGTLIAYQNTLTFQKNHNTTVNFTWTPTAKGKVNLTVIVDPHDAISEFDEENNQRSMFLQIQGIPELGVVNITVPSQPVTEGTPATFYTCLTNQGDENATNYQVNLYLEQTNTNYTPLGIEKNYTYVSIAMNHTINISLVWSQAQYGGSAYHGRWVAGIKILTNSSKPDSFTDNNTLVRYNKRLQVEIGERYPPAITFLSIPKTQEQGLPAQFLIAATDESGIDTVTIAIKNPQNKFSNGTMTPLTNNQYQYIFKNTSILGAYSYTITAVDGSFNKTKKTVKGGFSIITDRTPPIISYADAYPSVQLSNSTVEIQCIASDTSGIMGVEVTIVFPDAHTEVDPMENTSDNMKYTYIGHFSRVGKYQYSIQVLDNLYNQNTTDTKVFWITHDLNDTDSDGMPDTWEKRYELNPYDPSDAALDADNDSVTNLEEYKAGTNPLAKESKTSDSLQILRDNGVYVLGFIIVCIVIGALAFYRFRRKN
jgi:hypothetical protein